MPNSIEKYLTVASENGLPGRGNGRRIYRDKYSVKMMILRPRTHAYVCTRQCMMTMDHVCSSWFNVSVFFDAAFIFCLYFSTSAQFA